MYTNTDAYWNTHYGSYRGSYGGTYREADDSYTHSRAYDRYPDCKSHLCTNMAS
jgi:hypothetical protein